jgi:hypothetical protein
LVSLRHDFPDSFYRFLNPLAGQPATATFGLERRHFPILLSDQTLQISQPVVVWPQVVRGTAIDTASLALELNGSAVGDWISDNAGSARGFANVAGSPIRSWAIKAVANRLDQTSLED